MHTVISATSARTLIRLQKILIFILFAVGQLQADNINDAKAMIAEFGPVVKFAEGEEYFPSSLEWMIKQDALYKEGQKDPVVPVRKIIPADLATTASDYYLSYPALGGVNDTGLQKYYRGEPPVNNIVTAPCYINYQVYDNGNKAVMQVFFIYPFNPYSSVLISV